MIADNISSLLEKIENIKAKHRISRDIKLIAVSKYSSDEEIKEAFFANQIAFGENKVQDLVRKSSILPPSIEWHFIGFLQENKINALLKIKPFLMHSLSSLNLALSLQKRLERDNAYLDCLLQINVSRESSKSGFEREEAFDSYLKITQLCPNIRLKGLMTIGSNVEDYHVIYEDFSFMREIFERLEPHGASVLSMGMSNDYEIAIECGSNCLRIGSAIFKS